MRARQASSSPRSPTAATRATRKGDYHDLDLPPRHAYVAFYLWLRAIERIDAMIHLRRARHARMAARQGGRAFARPARPRPCSARCRSIYPFIVNNPGEAAQAKRRIGAVTIGHLTPPLIAAGSHGAAHELEALFDEFAQAQALDPRRARAIARD